MGGCASCEISVVCQYDCIAVWSVNMTYSLVLEWMNMMSWCPRVQRITLDTNPAQSFKGCRKKSVEQNTVPTCVNIVSIQPSTHIIKACIVTNT